MSHHRQRVPEKSERSSSYEAERDGGFIEDILTSYPLLTRELVNAAIAYAVELASDRFPVPCSQRGG
jgi:hypothetical protein